MTSTSKPACSVAAASWGSRPKTRDLIPLFNQLGLNYEDFVRLLSDPTGVQQLKDMKEEFLDLALAADTDAAGDAFQDQAIAARDAAQGLEDYKNSTDAALLSQEELDTFLQGTALTQGEITGAMSKQTVAVGRAEVLWKRLLNDLKDGRADTDQGDRPPGTHCVTNWACPIRRWPNWSNRNSTNSWPTMRRRPKSWPARSSPSATPSTEYNRVVGSADFGAAAFEGATDGGRRLLRIGVGRRETDRRPGRRLRRARARRSRRPAAGSWTSTRRRAARPSVPWSRWARP